MKKKADPGVFPRCEVCTGLDLDTGDREQFNRARTLKDGVLVCDRHAR